MPSLTAKRSAFSMRLAQYWQLMRLDKPTGTLLLLFPGLWSLLLHLPLSEATGLLAIFTLGALLMRSAGCILNDLTDRKLDAKVERTKSRPLASGAVHPLEALLLLAALLTASLALLWQLNLATRLLGVAAVALVVAYPFMKRITWWPQAFLGLTFNWAVLMASTAATGHITLPAVLLYLGCILWTIGYDTIYAHQDREDDALIGIKSSARRLGERTGRALQYCYGGFVLCLTLAGLSAGLHPVYYLAVLACALHLSRQIAGLHIHNPALCMALFKRNAWLGPILLAGLAAAQLAA